MSKRQWMAFITIFCVVLTAACGQTPAQGNKVGADKIEEEAEMEATPINAWDYVQKLGFGWNLGNTLDAWTGKKDTTPHASETAWGNPITQEEVAILLKQTGFDILRVPVTWMDHIGPAPEYTVDAAWMDRVKTVVNYGIDNGLTVILNLHHEDWHFPTDENYEDARACLVALWAQIAETFAAYDERLIFEGMNEPRLVNTQYEWTGGTAKSRQVVNRLNADFVKTVRESGGHNAVRLLMLPTYAASAEEMVIADFVLPDPEDQGLIVSLHAYTPYEFALQPEGLSSWSAEKADRRAAIDALFERIDKYFLSKNIPVIIGEMGAVNRNNTESRVAWAQYYGDKARERGIPCVWWDNGNVSGSGERFGMMDRTRFEWAFPQIVDAFLGK